MTFETCPCTSQVCDFAAFNSKIVLSVDFSQRRRFGSIASWMCARLSQEKKICDRTCVSCKTTGWWHIKQTEQQELPADEKGAKAPVDLCVLCFKDTCVFPMNGTFFLH